MRILIALFFLICSAFAARPTVKNDHSEPHFRVWEEALPPEGIEALTKDAILLQKYEVKFGSLKFGKYRTRWFVKGTQPRTVFELYIQKLYDIVKPGPNNAGAEYWVQNVPADRTGKIGFHVDKDESIASLKMYLSHPEMATVSYLTDHGGSTWVSDQWSPNGNGYSPVNPGKACLVSPRKGKILAFWGELLHGVMPGRGRAGTTRTTFLVNFWDHRPEPPNCLNLDLSEVDGLQTYTPEELEALQASWGEVQTKKAKFKGMDMTPKTKFANFMYTITLPGKAKLPVRVPSRYTDGDSMLLRYKKKKAKKAKKAKDEL